MRRFAGLILCLALVAFVAGTVFAAGEPVQIAKAGKIRVDGKLADWAGIPAVYVSSALVADVTDVMGDDDNSFFAMFAYDAKNVYVAARVIDDVINQPRTDNFWEQDTVEVWFASKQYGLTVSAGKAVAEDFMGNGKDGIEVKVVPAAGGYIVEAAFPIALVEKAIGAKVASGTKFQISIGTDDNDEGQTRQGQLYFPAGWKWNDTTTYATAIFQ